MKINMRFQPVFLLITAILFLQCTQHKGRIADSTASLNKQYIETYLTDPDGIARLSYEQDSINTAANDGFQIHINSDSVFQSIDGFGFALTGGSALHINSMVDSARVALLKELFGQAQGQLGLSYIRVSIGASDLDALPFSYNDSISGNEDLEMKYFSIAPDRKHLIPVLKEIQQINPDIQIMASPWSPPSWMKSNKSTKGGKLLAKYYDAYALYFVKYIEAYAQEGIIITSITVQNEPLHPGNNPSLSMLPAEQANFIKNSLGPAFEKFGIKTKIIIYDHNADRPDYPISILNDPEAAKYIDGSAFHLYAGDIGALTKVHENHPQKNLYFTEQWYGAKGNFKTDFRWHLRELIIGSTRNWSKCVIEWNLSSSPSLEPHTDGGCNQCLGAITIDGNEVTRNAGYYVIGHASAFVPPNSTRIASNYSEELPNVAFETPDNHIILIVLNNSELDLPFSINQGLMSHNSELSAGSVATYIWSKK